MTDTPLKVLLVEDEPQDARLVELLLDEWSNARFEMKHALKLSTAGEFIARENFDVVLLDLNLKETSGLETLAAMQATTASLPIVVMTGLEDEDTALEAVRRGAQDYLVKGEADAALLAKSLIYAVERYRTEQQVRESEMRMRMLTQQVPAIMWTTDKGLRFTSSLGRELDALGLQQDKVCDKTIPEYFSEESKDHPLIAMHEQAVEGKETSANVHWADRWFHVHVEPLRNATQLIEGTIGVALDITDLYQMQQDIEAAQRIQQHLLPKSSPELSGFDIAGVCYPAARCSGDYYDFITMRNENLAIVLADAVGHGFGPAILASMVRCYLRAAAMEGKEVHEMLTYANWLLSSESQPDQYVTLFCCQLDPHKKSFTYAGAGHQAFLIDADGQPSVIESKCLPLGIEEHEVFQLSHSIAFRPGDMLLLLTDGVVESEAADGKRFGMRRTIRTILENRDKPAQEIVNAIYKAVREYIQPAMPNDDITAVIVKVE